MFSSILAIAFVLRLLQKLLGIFICQETREEVTDTKNYFYQFAGFLGVIGCIDGSH